MNTVYPVVGDVLHGILNEVLIASVFYSFCLFCIGFQTGMDYFKRKNDNTNSTEGE